MLALTGCEKASLRVADGTGPDPELPPPDASLVPTVTVPPAVGWPDGGRPIAAEGLAVTAFAQGLDHPRWVYVLPNGDVLVAETNAPPRPQDGEGVRGWIMGKLQERAGAGVPSANRITLLRDTDNDGRADLQTPFLTDLNSPFGMALVGNDLYIANTDALVRFDYRRGTTRIESPGEHIADLPAGPINHHWTKNVLAGPDGRVLFVTSGSNSNIGENGMEAEVHRAAILTVDPATGSLEVYAAGLRNPNGLAWQPDSGQLWTTVNERDELGSDLVPDYMTAVTEGGFYGWPYSYYGQHLDERVQPQKPELVKRAIVPDYALGPHTASLGLAFYDGSLFPRRYRGGAFVGQHGSWNREPISGYKVIFVPFEDGKPAGKPQDILTGFVSEDGEARGRPVGVAIDRAGALLVADDVGNTVWRVTPRQPATAMFGG
jgi:glucose/arabinose dehydrogenase